MAEIAERLPEDADEVVLGRRVSASGRTSAFVAGRAASASDLKLLGGRLLAFYGQHEHRKLTISSAQMEVLDGFAGQAHLELREELPGGPPGLPAAWRRSWRSCASAMARGSATSISIATSSAEIEEVAPDPTEAAGLASERERLHHAEGLREAAAGAQAATIGADEDGGGAVGALAQAEALLQGVGGVDAGLDALAARIGALAIELGDVAGELRDYLDGLEADPGRLAAIEERLEALDRLQRKHGGSIDSVLAHAEHCRVEIVRLENAEERWAEVEVALGRDRSAPDQARRQARQGAGQSGAPAGARGGRGAGATGDAGCAARGRAGGAPRRLRHGWCRDGRAEAGAESRAWSRRRCATRHREASSRE